MERMTAMPSPASQQPRPGLRAVSRQGFSLIELLVVIAIIGVLATLGFTAISDVLASRGLTSAGTILSSRLATARQTAIAQNARVRWELLKIPDPRNGDPEAFRLIRIRIFDPENREWTTHGKLEILPLGVIVDDADSTLLVSSHLTTISDLEYANFPPTAEAASVDFAPDGRTLLDLNEQWSLTAKDPNRINDFLTIQIDPVTGSTRFFRP